MNTDFSKRNFQKELEKNIDMIVAAGKTPWLLLHSCCAPCSSYCIEYLSRYFKITVFYYNPNISSKEEYRKRVEEQIRFIKEFPTINPVDFIEGDYDTESFYSIAKGLEKCPEGGERCFKCYELRLDRTGKLAKELGVDYFTTTLTISPQKNSAKLNETGLKCQEKYGVQYLLSDFKKKDGYKRSIELSKEYDLYRQNYCGCVYSKSSAGPSTEFE
ncbi:MAG: epoxyqueuosine reductase QueH [Lachnospira sp.]